MSTSSPQPPSSSTTHPTTSITSSSSSSSSASSASPLPSCMPPFSLSETQAFDRTPSRESGISAVAESMRRLELWSFINNLRKATDVAQLCASTAAVYLHRYLASTPLSADMDYYVAAACFFLGCKAEESPKGIDAVAVHAYNAIHHTSLDIKSGSSVKEVHELKEIILGLELKVLHAIAFDLQIIKPYKYLLARLQLWGVVQREAVQYAWNTVNDCFLTQACLVWGPEVLADACVVVSWHKRRDVMGEPVGGISEAQVDELMRVDAVARAVARLEACFETVQQEIARRRAPMPA